MSTSPITITDESYDQLIKECPLPVVLDFWADWCPPCKLITPWMERLAKSHGDQVRVGMVNVDECPAIVERCLSKGMPTILFMKKGEIIHRQVDQLNEQDLGELVQKHLLANS